MPHNNANNHTQQANDQEIGLKTLKIMTLKNKNFSKIELQNLLDEVKTRPLTDEETDILWNMYYERWGNASFGRCLHPYWLLHDMEHTGLLEIASAEEDDVKEWQIRADIEEFEQPNLDIPDVDITFMCDKPKDCYSHQLYGNACKCIRENFYSETVFERWREKQIKELGERIKNIIPLH